MAKLIKYIKLKKSSSCSRYSSFFSFAMSSYTFFSSSGSPQAKMAKGPPCRRSQVRQHSRYELCCANPCAKEQNHEHTMTHYIRHVCIYIYTHRNIYISHNLGKAPVELTCRFCRHAPKKCPLENPQKKSLEVLHPEVQHGATTKDLGFAPSVFSSVV